MYANTVLECGDACGLPKLMNMFSSLMMFVLRQNTRTSAISREAKKENCQAIH